MTGPAGTDCAGLGATQVQAALADAADLQLPGTQVIFTGKGNNFSQQQVGAWCVLALAPESV